MRPRMRDVAQRAGVSPKTVSNVVNGYAHVSTELRTRVLDAIDELNYVPNVSARNLRTGRTGVIALALPDLGVSYFAELARHITTAAEERDFTILIDQTEGRPERERKIATGLRNNVIDGLIFSPLSMDVDDIEAAASDTPMVLLGEREHPANIDHVAFDNVAAARTATRHLVRLGRRRIASIGSQVNRGTGTGALRLEGYFTALTQAGLPHDESLVVPTRRLHRAEGVQAMDELLDLPEPPDAVVCFNDLVAMGALYTLRRRGVRVPDDVAVVGFDDIEESSYSNPTLTTVSPDKVRIARTAVDLLVRRLEEKGAAQSREVLVDFELVERESTQVAG